MFPGSPNPDRGDWRVIGPTFAVVLGTACLAVTAVGVVYVVWIRMVGLDPTIAQMIASLPMAVKAVLAILLGLLIGSGAEVAPTVEMGVSAAIFLAASALAGLICFEVYVDNGSIRG